MSRRQEPALSPFILTFCRPSNVPPEGRAHQVFALVSDGFHEARISVWPKLGLPFPMNLDRTLSIRVFVAEDELMFDRGACKEVAICYLPFWRLPEVVTTNSTLSGLPELWLALEAPKPLRPPVFDGATAASSGEAEVTAAEKQDAAFRAAILGRFERSRELATQEPLRARICVIVQPRQDVSSAMFGMIRHQPVYSSSPHFGLPETLTGCLGGGGGYPNPYSAYTTATRGNPVLDAMPIGGALVSGAYGHGAALFGGGASAPASMPPEQQAPQQAPAPSRPPVGESDENGDSSGTGGRPPASETFWRSKWEDERALFEERKAGYNAEMKVTRCRTGRVATRLEKIGLILKDRNMHCLGAACFSIWCLWVSSEKSGRQFEQLANDCSNFRHNRDLHNIMLQAKLDDSMLRLQGQEKLEHLRARRSVQRVQIVEDLLRKDADNRCNARAFTAWHSLAAQFAFAQHHVEKRLRNAGRCWARIAMISWRAEAGWRNVENLRKTVEVTQGDLPTQIRREAADRVRRAVELTGSRHPHACTVTPSSSSTAPPLCSDEVAVAGDPDSRVTAAAAAMLQTAGGHELLGGIVRTWSRVAAAASRHRRRLATVLSSGLRTGLETSFLVVYLVQWRRVVTKTEAAVESEREIGNKVMDVSRRRAAQLLVGSFDIRKACDVHAVFVCWCLYIAHGRGQRELERVFTEQQKARERADRARQELEAQQKREAEENAVCQDRLAMLSDALRAAEEERNHHGTALKQVVEAREKVDQDYSQAVDQSRSLAAELGDTKARILNEAKELEAFEANPDFYDEALTSRVLVYEEESVAAATGLQRLQQEAARFRERRQRDIREARNQLRTQALRQEATAERLARAHKDDEAQRALKLRQSEARVSRLSEDVQNLRVAVKDVPEKTEALEQQNAELLRKVQDMEKQLRLAESAERERRIEFAQLKGANEELRSRRKALEAACAASEIVAPTR